MGLLWIKRLPGENIEKIAQKFLAVTVSREGAPCCNSLWVHVLQGAGGSHSGGDRSPVRHKPGTQTGLQAPRHQGSTQIRSGLLSDDKGGTGGRGELSRQFAL